MRHLLNTYIQADPAVDLGGLGEMSLRPWCTTRDLGQ